MRFRAIDTFRGIAAILVILFHMKGFIQILAGNVMVQKSDIFVDFFFVLSGFVITYSNIDKLTDGQSIRAFIIKRAYRIYPLHVFTLLLAVLLETLRFLIDQYVVRLTHPVFATNNLSSLLANLTLTHSLGLFDHLTWNIPSWSISTEFYTYIIWAVSVVLFRRKTNALILIYFSAIACFIYHQNGSILFTYDYGIIRCLYGFLCGMTLCQFTKNRVSLNYRSGFMLEAATLALTIFFVYSYTEGYSWLMPIWFAFVIFIFSQESGIISILFAHRRIEFLGRLSYSYYLNHSVILAVYEILFFKVIKLPHNPVYEALYVAICLASVHVASAITHKHIELRFLKKPARSSTVVLTSLHAGV